MSRKTPARVRREQSRAEFARVLGAVLFEEDVTQQQLAAATGACTSVVQRWGDPEQAQVPGVPDLLQMPRGVALRILRWVASHFGFLVTEVIDVASVDVSNDNACLGAVARIAKETGEAVAELTMALRDGKLDDTELPGAYREVMDAVHELVPMAQALREEAERRGIKGLAQ